MNWIKFYWDSLEGPEKIMFIAVVVMALAALVFAAWEIWRCGI